MLTPDEVNGYAGLMAAPWDELNERIVSANIKCTETPTESAVHFFFFIDQMRRR